MKNSKVIIAILCAIVLIFSLAACAQQKGKTENVTQAVTNENGEVVTGENGEAITEEIAAQIVTDAQGKAVTEVVTGTDGKPLTTIQNNKYVNVTQIVTQPVSGGNNSNTQQGKTSKGSGSTAASTTKKADSKADTTATTKKKSNYPADPKSVSSLSASGVTLTSVKLSWGKLDCSGYQIACSTDGGANWKYLEKAYTKTSYTAKELISNTNYIFRVRAFNKNSEGTAYSKWKSVKVKTKEETTPRKITVSVVLPMSSAEDRVLTVKIDGKEIKKANVKLNGETYSFTTDEKYKGEVEITASLNTGEKASAKTDKEECLLEILYDGIPVIADDED